MGVIQQNINQLLAVSALAAGGVQKNMEKSLEGMQQQTDLLRQEVQDTTGGVVPASDGQSARQLSGETVPNARAGLIPNNEFDPADRSIKNLRKMMTVEGKLRTGRLDPILVQEDMADKGMSEYNQKDAFRQLINQIKEQDTEESLKDILGGKK